MSTKTDIVNLVVRVNGDNAKKEYTELKARAAELSVELKGMKKGTDEYIAKSKELKEVQSRYEALRKEMDLNSLSIKDLKKEISKMKAVKAELDPASEAFKTLSDKIKTAEARMKDLNEGGSFLSRTFDFLKKEAMGFGVVMLGALGIDYVIGKIGNLIQRQSELSDSFAKIRRTTGMTQEQVEGLNKSLSKIDTRTAKKELREIAVVLGQVNEAASVENIAAIDKIVVALGDEFKGGAEEISTSLSVLRNNFTTFKSNDYAKDIEHIGNALVVLGNAGLATAPVVTDMATRMSGVLGTFKVTAGQTLGLAAAMQEMGITVERGSTAVTKLVQKMTQHPDVFAKVAGAKTKEEVASFIKLLNEDAVAALLKVAKGSKLAANSNVEFGEILKELESSGAGVSEVLSKLAVNGDLVREKIDLASESIAKGDTIQKNFAISNENLAAKVEKLKKQFAGLWESEAVTNFLKSAVDGAFKFIGALKSLGGFIERNWYLIKAIILAYGAYYIASGRLIAVKTVELALSKAKIAALAAENFAINAIVLIIRIFTGEIFKNIAASAAYNLVAGAMTLNINRMVAAWRLLTATMSVNPIIAIVTALTAATYAITGYIEKMQAAKLAQEELLDKEKTDAYIKYRADTFKAESIAIINDIKEGNKIKLQLDLEALDAANTIRLQEIKQLKANADEKQKIAGQTKMYVKGYGVYGYIDKTDEIIEKDKKIAENAMTNLQDAQAKQEEYAKLRASVADKLIDLDNQQIEHAKELAAKEKAELEKRKRDLEKYLEDVRREFEKIAQLKDQVERAKIMAIEEANAREILLLEQSHKEKETAINKEIEDERTRITKLINEGKRLGQSTAKLKDELVELDRQKMFLLLGNQETFNREMEALKQKQRDDAEKKEYEAQLKNLNDFNAVQKLVYSKLYADGLINKYEYDTKLQELDISGKQKLIEIAKKYGIDVTKVTQDLYDAEIKIMTDSIARKKALLQREADFRVELARYTASKNPNSKDAQQELLQAQLAQLQTQMEIELEMHIGHQDEMLQIVKEYDLKKQKILDEAHANQIGRNVEIANQYIQIFNDAAQKIFDFKGQKIEQEYRATQAKLSKEQADNEQQYKNRLLSDVDYNNRKKTNQDKLDKAEKEAKRKKAVNDKLAAIFNIILQTAQGIATAVAQSPFTGGLPGSAIAATMGALELAFVTAQPVPQFYTGGYTKVKGAEDSRNYDAKLLPNFGSGYVSTPAILVGERGKEYVVNNSALNNPKIKFMTDAIEGLSRGYISQVDFDNIFSIPALQQHYKGSYTTPENIKIPNINSINDSKLQTKLIEVFTKLSGQIDAGISAKIGDNTIVDFNERNKYLQKIIDEAN